MKRIIIVAIIAILCNSLMMAQNLKLGGSADILLGGKNISYMFGPSTILEYRFQNLPFSVLGNTHFYLSELSNEEKYLSNFTYTTFGLGASVNYYPFSWAIEPYLGFGVMFNTNNISQPGNAHFIDGKEISLRKVDNNISADIKFGLLLSANSPINVIFESSYRINKPESEIALISYPNEEIIKNNLDFNSVFFKIGLVFKL
jgi:hypothetical protein